jgi:rRNA maturation protein Rpf1
VIGLTTGRQTSQRLNSLLKELANAIPRSKIIRRGKSSLDELTARFLEEGISHALALYRWQGGPGRIDFFRVDRTGLSQMVPSILISRVRLGREYPDRERHKAQGITCERDSSEGTKNFWQRLSEVLELPRVELPTDTKLATTLHISEKAGGAIDVAITSPPGVREVGPTLTIRKLLWDLDESKKKA